MATLMRTDGSTEEIKDIHLVPYDQLRSLLDGPVEYIYFDDGRVLLVNEEFKFRGFPLNLQATTLIDGHYDKVHGPAIIMSAEEFQKVKQQASGEFVDE
jgi:hypothetical protein